jgi:hypothetical protein
MFMFSDLGFKRSPCPIFYGFRLLSITYTSALHNCSVMYMKKAIGLTHFYKVQKSIKLNKFKDLQQLV